MTSWEREDGVNCWSEKYIKFLKDIAEKNYDFYIAVTRKGYYFAQIQCRKNSFEDTAIFEKKLLRDRDVAKSYDLSFFIGKKVLLFDDTANTGETLRKLKETLEKKTDHKITVDVAAFSVSHDVLKKRTGQNLFGESKLYFQCALSKDEMAEFSLHELREIHDLMVAYVIDLPVFKKVQLTQEQFQSIFGIDHGNWSFHDYSFELYNKTYANGFFLYENVIMEQILGDALLACVVKCRYEQAEEAGICKYYAVFTPFVIIKSVLYEDMRNCLLALYDGTEYEDVIREKAPSWKQEDNYIGIYRDVVYNLSYFIGEVFRQYIDGKCSVSLAWDYNLTSSLQNEIMKQSIDKVFKEFSVEKYLNRLYKCRFFYQRKPNIRIAPYGNTGFTDVRDFVLSQLGMWKLDELKDLERDERFQDGYALFEDIEDIMSNEFVYQNKSQFHLYFAQIILLALDCSVMSNDLIFSNGEIKRIFRYGEGSEIYFGYDANLLYRAVYTYYNSVGTSNERYQKYYESFIIRLYNYLQSNAYFESGYISRKAFWYFASYFKLSESILEREIRNKRFVLKNKEQTNPYYRAVEKFVSNLVFD